MNLISFNVNGVRAILKKGFLDWIKSTNPDILCLQEIKANENQIDKKVFEQLGYYSYWFSAKKQGYSGVAVLSKKEPKNVIYGCSNTDFDEEGRLIQVDFENYSVINVYVPSASNIDRLSYKMDFSDHLLNYVKSVEKAIPNLIICGDFNICHQAIDIHDPAGHVKKSGFLPEERKWMTKFLKDCNLVDSFRQINSSPNQYTWWSYRTKARERNKGWRIDYFMISETIADRLERSYILTDVYSSDHCPIGIKMQL